MNQTDKLYLLVLNMGKQGKIIIIIVCNILLKFNDSRCVGEGICSVLAKSIR